MNLISPEQLALEKQVAEIALLEKELADKELKLHDLETNLNKFNLRYKQKVGKLYAELDRVNADIAKIEAGKFKTPESERNAEEADKQAKQSAFEAGIDDESQKLLDEPDLKVEPTEELRQLFKKAAMKFHPDRTTDEAEKVRRTKLMSELNKAYDAGDVDKIKALIDGASADPDEITGSDLGSKLIKAIRQLAQIQKRIADIDAQIKALEQSDDYLLMDDVLVREKSGLDPLAVLAETLKDEIKSRLSYLDKLKEDDSESVTR